jgi:hypothetical protein
MSLGFIKQYDTSIYDVDEFMEVWPEISEIGMEIMDGVLDQMDASTMLTPGTKSDLVAYVKGCVFMLGFSGVDEGTDVQLYDQHMSNAVIRSRMVMNAMKIEVDMVDVVDRQFVESMRLLFEISDEQQVSRLWSVLKKNKATSQLPISIEGLPKTRQTDGTGVKNAEVDPNASQPLSTKTTSTIKGKDVRPGINFPIDPTMAEKSIQYSLSKDGSKQLSPNFKVSDFKCRDGSDVILVNPSLIDILEKIRKHFGKPVKITSGYRTPKYNGMLKGAVKNSQHMYGNAADIKIDGVSSKEVYDWLNSWHKGGLGLYPTFTHVDVRNTVGRGLARWGGGKSAETA